MTIVTEPEQLPALSHEELATALETLFHGYLAQLDAEHPQWSQDEVALVRSTREVLQRAGRDPRLSYDQINHIDTPYANKPLQAQSL